MSGYENPLKTPYEIGELMDKASDHPKAGRRFRDAWRWTDQDREIYDALEHVMRGRYEKLVEQVNEGEGFELLRLACRKFDPKAPRLKQHLKAQFYRLPDDKCKNFAAVLERVDLIERLCKAMTEATGERPDDEFLAEILVPGMDQNTLLELDISTLVAYDHLQKQNIRRPIDKENYEEVREFIQRKQQCEQLSRPIAPRKMDVSNVQTPAGDYGLREGEQPAWSGGAEVENPPTPTWGENDIDALRKGKGGKKGERRQLQCHNCGGLGHPFRLCTSAYGAKEKQGTKCENCGGYGHNKQSCPSEGGGKYKAPEKTDKGKGKGKGKEQSRYFQGKGSGMSSLDNEAANYSPAEWNEWMNQQKTQAQPQNPVGPGNAPAGSGNGAVPTYGFPQTSNQPWVTQGSMQNAWPAQNVMPWITGGSAMGYQPMMQGQNAQPGPPQNPQIRQMNIQSVAPRDPSMRVPLAMITRKEQGYNKVKRENRKARKDQVIAKEEEDLELMRQSMKEFGKDAFDEEVVIAEPKKKTRIKNKVAKADERATDDRHVTEESKIEEIVVEAPQSQEELEKSQRSASEEKGGEKQEIPLLAHNGNIHDPSAAAYIPEEPFKDEDYDLEGLPDEEPTVEEEQQDDRWKYEPSVDEVKTNRWNKPKKLLSVNHIDIEPANIPRRICIEIFEENIIEQNEWPALSTSTISQLPVKSCKSREKEEEYVND